MKKQIAWILAVCMIMALTACTAPKAAALPDETPDASASASAPDSSEEAQPAEQPADAPFAGPFTAEDVTGAQTYTESFIADHDLTLVNVMATWCGPCIAEMPELEQLSREMAERNIAVFAIVTDALGSDGAPDASAVDTAQQIIEIAEITFPMVIPDTALLEACGRIMSFPTSFLVNSKGEIVGGPYEGARSADMWAQLIDEALA